MRRLRACSSILGIFALVLLANPVTAQWDLIINTTGATPAQQERIDAAEALWETVIAGYQNGISNSSVTIDISFSDLGGGTLGQAAPTSFVNQGGFRLSTAGFIDLDDGLGLDTVEDVTAHEIGHVIGIGTLWDDNGVYVDGSGQYTGQFGLAAYQEEFDPAATFVPVELDGGPGTANAHWDESGFFTDEIMSGFLSGSNFLSNTTIESLRDIGFDTLGRLADLTGVEGDVNQDGFVNALDVTAFVDGWRSNTAGLDAVERTLLGDLDLSGRTDLSDLFILHQALPSGGRRILATQFSDALPIPEPSSLLLLATAVLARLMPGIRGAALGER